MTGPDRAPFLIPRSLFFGGAHRSLCRLSPDGRHVSWLAPSGGALQLFVAPADDLARPRSLTRASGGVAAYVWAPSSRHIVYAHDFGGDENWQLHSLDIDGETDRELTPVGANARIYGTSPERTQQILVGLNDRDPRWHDVHLVDLVTGERDLQFLNDQRLFGFLCDRQLRVRFALRAEAGGRSVVRIRDGATEPWRFVAAEDELATWLVGLDAAGETLYWVGSEGGDKATLRAQRLDGDDANVLASHAQADVADVVVDARGRPIAARAEPLEPTWIAAAGRETAAGDDFFRLIARLGDAIQVVSQTSDGRSWLVAHDPADRPPAYYRFDRPQTLIRLFSARPDLETATLAGTRARIVPARDAMPLTTYLTLPPDREPTGLPLVVWVHGGPWRRDSRAFDVRRQWLASRGYAVLGVNFRGSTGFGKAFVNAGDREWAGKMHSDLLDAMEHVIDEGIVDRSRVAIAGQSYGGYAALVGLTFTPDVFACGISICGPANLVTSQTGKPPYWASAEERRARRIGDPRTEEGRALLAARSPIHIAFRIARPLLVAHGANDPRVRREESDQIVEAALRNGVPVTYVVYADEGHGFSRPANALSFYAVMEQFLANHLAGQAEPMDDVPRPAAMQIVTGAEHVHGPGR